MVFQGCFFNFILKWFFNLILRWWRSKHKYISILIMCSHCYCFLGFGKVYTKVYIELKREETWLLKKVLGGTHTISKGMLLLEKETQLEDENQLRVLVQVQIQTSKYLPNQLLLSLHYYLINWKVVLLILVGIEKQFLYIYSRWYGVYAFLILFPIFLRNGVFRSFRCSSLSHILACKVFLWSLYFRTRICYDKQNLGHRICSIPCNNPSSSSFYMPWFKISF